MIPKVMNTMEEGDEESYGFNSGTSSCKKQQQNHSSMDSSKLMNLSQSIVKHGMSMEYVAKIEATQKS